MSRNFTRASSHRLEASSTGMNWDVPYSLVAWFRSVVNNVDGRILSIGTGGAGNNQGSIGAIGTTGGDPFSAVAYSTEVFCNTSTGFTANTWHNGIGVYRSNTDRSAYIDGGSEGTSSTNRGVDGDNVIIGARFGSSPADYFDGQIGHAAIYNGSLAPNEVQAIGKGVPPTRVARLILKNFWPLYGFQSPEQDVTSSGVGLTLVNSPGTSDLMPPVCPLRTRRAAA